MTLELGKQLAHVVSETDAGDSYSTGPSTSLTAEQATVVLRDIMALGNAKEVMAGDKVRVTGRMVVTNERMNAYTTENPARRH